MGGAPRDLSECRISWTDFVANNESLILTPLPNTHKCFSDRSNVKVEWRGRMSSLEVRLNGAVKCHG
jgi:hypothetical protein